MGRYVLAAILAASLGATGAAAQGEVDRAGAQVDWSVFQTGEAAARVCWIVSKPKAIEARRAGKKVTASRGDIYLMVAARPAQNIRNEVSTVVGYTLKKNSTVRVNIGGTAFSMFVEGDKAWLENAAADDRMIEAMKKGAQATLTAESERGTTTIDTYSLNGFTAALSEAQRLCK